MKRILLLLTLFSFISLSSCSSDDDNSNNSNPDPDPTPTKIFNAKINGVLKNFTVINVVEVPYQDYTDLEITAKMADDPSVLFQMNMEKGNDGLIYFMQYTENENYYQITESFAAFVTENSNNKVKGTFSGTMSTVVEPFSSVTVTDGVFDINY